MTAGDSAIHRSSFVFSMLGCKQVLWESRAHLHIVLEFRDAFGESDATAGQSASDWSMTRNWENGTCALPASSFTGTFSSQYDSWAIRVPLVKNLLPGLSTSVTITFCDSKCGLWVIIQSNLLDAKSGAPTVIVSAKHWSGRRGNNEPSYQKAADRSLCKQALSAGNSSKGSVTN